ncbi:MAG: EAL domain-containing protein [Acidimicrobiia bacterium]|nr:EAL domain-containing protein [Acidimicrobiia bacterium]
MNSGPESTPVPSADLALLALMLDHATDGICLVASDGRILATTPAIERMLGCGSGELRGTNGLELLHPDDVEAALDRLGQLGEDVPEDYRPYRFLHRSGHYITVELVARENPQPLAESPEGSLVLTVRDITEWQETRVLLDDSRARRELIASLASMFVDAVDTEMDATVDQALEHLAIHCGADRGFILRLSPDGRTMTRSHGWATAEAGFVLDDNDQLTIDDYPVWSERLANLETVIANVADQESDSARESALIPAVGVTAFIAVPMVREGHPIGIVGMQVLDEPHTWSDDDVEVLRVATDILGSALARRDASAETLATEARFRAMVEHSSDALIVIDAQAVISHFPIGENLFGYAPDELVGTNALDLVHPDDLDFAATEMLKFLEDPNYHAINSMRIRHADGHWVPIELAASSRFDEPAINGVIMNVRDVTDRKRVEDQLTESEARHESLISNLPGAVFRCHPDPPYHDVFVTDAVEALTGYSPSEFISRAACFDHLILPEFRRPTDDAVETAKRERQPYTVEYPIRHVDGSTRWVSEHGRVIFDDTDTPIYLEGFIFDISSRVDAVEATRDRETQLANLIANVPGAVFRCHAEAPYAEIFISDAVAELTGYPAHALLRRDIDLYDLVEPEQRAEIDRAVADAVDHGNAYSIEYQFRHRDGSLRWVEERGHVLLDDVGRPKWIDGAMFDLTERKQLEHRLEYDAAHDPLTGLPNRTLLLRHLEWVIARGLVDSTMTATLFIDLDRFKLVNDALGHGAGDELLIHFSRRLSSVMRATDLAARTGGDEFVVVCSDLESEDEAREIADRIGELLQNPFTIKGRNVFVSASIGIAIADPCDPSADDMLRNADAAAYRAKELGRNRHEVFDDALRAATAAALEVETDLHRALDDHQLFLRYQPIVELASGELAGAEGLVRWQHPERGLLVPDEFLDAAEVSGLIVPLGREVLTLAVGAISDFPESFMPRLAINLSPRELNQPDLVDRVRATLEDRSVEPRRLCIEITESAVLDEVDSAIATLNALRDIGVRLAIDDFGTGYSSLSYLRRLPVDIVKIDRSFTAELDGDGANVTIVAGIVGLAQGLGLEVVAEGVETRRQLSILCELGCTYGQGFLFSEPVTLDEMVRADRSSWSRPDVRH